jgi:hypothetical protein
MLRRLRRVMNTALQASAEFGRVAATRRDDPDLDLPYHAADATAAHDFDDDDDDDARVDARVLSAFENDPVLSARAIEIDEPEPGVIVLTGRIGSARDAAHAVTIARGTPGVTEVENLLRVRRTSRR